MVRVSLSALMAVLLAGCVRHYKPPEPHEPHALVKVRVVHHSQPGPFLDHALLWNGEVVETADITAAGAPHTTAVRVHPKPTEWRAASAFYRIERRLVREPYYETEHYSCPSYGSSSSSYQSCSRQVQKWRDVWKDERMVTAQCESRLAQAPVVGQMYLLSFTFYEHGRCTLSCMVQVPGENGQFVLSPCDTRPLAP